MGKIKDLTGTTKGWLTALRCVGVKGHNALWRCSCLCGNEVEVDSGHFIWGKVKSCGCLKRELTAALNAGRHGEDHPAFKHGHAVRGGQSPTNRSWQAMKNRCLQPKHREYKWYGGTNPPVQICEGLREFTGFLSVLGERPDGKTLGRFGDINNYSCGQCEQCKQSGWGMNVAWQTKKEQIAEQKIKRARVARQGEDQVLDEIFATPQAA